MGRPLILLVDDEDINLAVLGAILGADYPLATARTGAEAIAVAAAQRPALVLLDVGLPDIGGLEVCRRLKQADASASLQVIFVTTHSSLRHEAEGFAAGASDYIAKPVSAPIVRARVAAHLALVRAAALELSQREAIAMLGEAGHYNDTDTGAHVWRMAAYAATLARACGWDEGAARQLELAAPMHDMGKIGIPQAILRKPGPLTEEEWVVMRRHPQIGFEILSKSGAPLFRLAAEVALHHHERWDGSGYPGALAGTAIPAAARIVALADLFDALSMARPYKQPWPLDAILAAVDAGAGRHFEPVVVAALYRELPQLLALQRQWQDRPDAGASGTGAADAPAPVDSVKSAVFGQN